MNSLFVVPKEGVVVKDPRTLRRIPPEGTTVPNDNYWRRRLREGSVSEVSRDKLKVSKSKSVE